jgi:hypothetical protein
MHTLRPFGHERKRSDNAGGGTRTRMDVALLLLCACAPQSSTEEGRLVLQGEPYTECFHRVIFHRVNKFHRNRIRERNRANGVMGAETQELRRAQT